MDRPATTNEIKVTPKMIRAGVKATCLFAPGEDPLGLVVLTVFRAMRSVQLADEILPTREAS